MSNWLVIGFLAFVLGILALDLGVFHRRDRLITIREALIWSGFWILMALIFTSVVYYLYENRSFGIVTEIGRELSGRQAALQYLAGYLLEKSLSLDNIFVIALIFGYFQVPLALQHRVLFWGVLGAILMRGVMIMLGITLLAQFQWMSYFFGVLLIFTAAKMLAARHDNLEPDKNPLVKMAKKIFPVTADFEGNRFFSRVNGKTAITPLFLALLVVESSDLLFAVDSIPAIFAVTTDPFLVFTSNIFAILGLRSLYFALAGLLHRFRYLKMSLVFVLAFVGVKMLLAHHHPIGVPVSLAMILGILSVGVIASIIAGHRDTAALVSPIVDELEELSRLTVRQAKRLAILIVGGGLFLAGVAMLFLPGPGILMIFAALTLLATHFVWARRLLRRARREARLIIVKGRRLSRKRDQ